MGRDAVREKGAAPSKESDLYSWAVRQAELLRAGRLSEIDPAASAQPLVDPCDSGATAPRRAPPSKKPGSEIAARGGAGGGL